MYWLFRCFKFVCSIVVLVEFSMIGSVEDVVSWLVSVFMLVILLWFM